MKVKTFYPTFILRTLDAFGKRTASIRLFWVCLLWMAITVNAFGAIEKTTLGNVCSNNPAEGLVYVSEKDMNIEDISGWTEKMYLWNFYGDTDLPPEETEYWIYAKPQKGYRFKEWRGVEINNSELISTSPKQKRTVKNDIYYYAYFSPITDPLIRGVSAYFSVYVDGKKVNTEEDGNYYIAKGKPVKITWGEDIECGFAPEMAPGENERFIEFTMPDNDLIIPLTSVTIPDGITEIRPFGLKGCKQLTSVTIPNTVSSIGESAFQDCSSLKTISIPGSVTRIDADAFKNSGLTDADYNGHKSDWNNVSVESSAFSSSVAIHWLCTVTFNANGHGTAPEPLSGNSGYKLNKPDDLSAPGYGFGGWYTDEALENEFDFNTALSDDVTLYAKWTPNDNIISFDTNGEGNPVPQQTVKTDEQVTEPPFQSSDSRCIWGWYKDKNCTQPYDFNTPVKEPMTLYAKWGPACLATLNMTNSEGGTCKLTDADGKEYAFEHLIEHLLPGIYQLTITANEGYSFGGNYIVTNRNSHISTLPYDFGGINYTQQINLTENDLDVNVEFTKIPTVLISTKSDGVATGCSYTLKDGNNNSYTDGSTLTHVFDETVMVWNPKYNLTLNIEKGEYGCMGTIVNMGKTEDITDNQTSYTIIPKGSISIELFFYTKTNTYNLVFESAGSIYQTITQTFGTEVTAPANPTREGYTFAGWDKSIPSTMPAENMTITALWKKQVTITAYSDSRVYNGKPLVNSGYTSTPLEEDDAFESVTVTGNRTDVGTTDNVPSAAVIRNADGDNVTDNYDITYANGTLEVTPKAATVKANDLVKEHDAADPTLTATVTGLAMGDEADVITYTLSRDNSGTPEGEKAGSYTITPTGEATQGNYTVTYETGLLTIAPKKGDVNSDESVDETDIQIVTSVIFSGLYISAADVNNDQVVNVADIVTICGIMKLW